MMISGFTMVKNATKLYYPVKQSIESILPLVDEFVVALGDCDDDDETEQEIKSIKSDKIKIVHTVWDIKKYPNGTENAHQTDIAKSNCKGKWLFYLQADEVVHEKDLPEIKNICEKYADDDKAEGILFNYYHFWGDYNHIHKSHGWYKKEIRIIKNKAEIHSWKSAQSFRKIPDFDGIHYRQKEGTYKLKVIKANAHIYHYGWVRPPKLMKKKTRALDTVHKGKKEAERIHSSLPEDFHYGDMRKITEFKGSHPKVMQEWIQKFDWKNQLDYYGKIPLNRARMKHEKPKYRFISFIENTFNISLGETNNYIILNK